MVDKPARVHCDGKAIKSFFSHISNNLHVSVQKRESFHHCSIVQVFFFCEDFPGNDVSKIAFPYYVVLF